MEHFYNTNNWQLLKSMWKRTCGLRCIFVFLFLSLLLMQPATENLCITKSTTRKKIVPTKYPREKLWTHKVPTRKKFGPTNTHEKILDPRNTHEKKFWAQEITTSARWHDGIRPTRPTITRDSQNLTHSRLT